MFEILRKIKRRLFPGGKVNGNENVIDIKETEEYKAVASSGLFDRDFYLKRYPDVAASGMDPIEHYVMYGWSEERCPSQKMEIILLEDNEGVFKRCRINPILYIIQNGLPRTPAGGTKAAVKVNLHNTNTSQTKKAGFNIIPLLNVLAFSVDRFREANEDKKLILLITHTLENTGAPRALFNMAVAMKELGHIPVILSFKNGPLKSVCKSLGIPVLLEPLSLFGKTALDTESIRFLNSFDILLFNTIVALRAGKAVKDTFPYKIAWIHEGGWEFDKNNVSTDYNEMFSYMDEVYAVGEYSKSYVDKYMGGEKQAGILLYGIESTETEQESCECIDSQDDNCVDKTGFVIAIVGTFCLRKAQDIVVEALPDIPYDIMSNIEIRFVGSSRDANMQNMVDEVAAKYENVKVYKEMPHDELIAMMKNEVDVLLCPSRDDPMPIVATEAMQAGKVVIISKNTGTASLIQDSENGYVLENISPEAVRNAIVKAYNQREDNKKMGEKAKYVYEQNFTREIFRDNIDRLIQRSAFVSRGLWE